MDDFPVVGRCQNCASPFSRFSCLEILLSAVLSSLVIGSVQNFQQQNDLWELVSRVMVVHFFFPRAFLPTSIKPFVSASVLFSTSRTHRVQVPWLPAGFLALPVCSFKPHREPNPFLFPVYISLRNLAVNNIITDDLLPLPVLSVRKGPPSCRRLPSRAGAKQGLSRSSVVGFCNTGAGGRLEERLPADEKYLWRFAKRLYDIR